MIDNLWIVFLTVFIIGLIVKWQMIERLRSRHPDSWIKLGKPTLWNADWKRFRSELSFLFNLRFVALNDGPLSVLATAYGVISILLVAMFVALMVQIVL